jgi:hypothetical protein
MKKQTISQIEEEIRNIQNELQGLGAMHPGSISKQYQVCGRAGCQCVDTKNPQRHGPYRKLSYVHRGKAVCRFVRAGTEQALGERLAVYKRFRELTDRWVALSILRAKIDFFPQEPNDPKKKKSQSAKSVHNN